MTTRLDPLRWACAATLLLACTPSDPPLPGGEHPYDVVAYALRGEYDWDAARLRATVDVSFTIDATPGSIVLDSAVTVTAVHAADGRELTFLADPERQTLEIDISPLAPADELQVTITYEAAASEALRAFPARAGDPVTTRSVYSFSEPLDVQLWMPCHNRPDDRARFSVEMRMNKGEALIGNGSLGLDETEGETRRMRWSTDYTLPTYLMAFAVGPFATAGKKYGDIELGAWYRPGLDGEYDLVVSELDRMMRQFEDLLGPYPFEKYQLVLLPAVGGGIEHAGITFQSENSSNQPGISGDLALTAHELAHQWWGDMVTVTEWNDVWIKEGFASLLETEPLRLGEDQSDAGTLMGDFQGAYAGEAIRDPALAPPDKYNSGPYGRAAWLLTQIRGVVGDESFFTTVRELLDTHAFATIGTDDMIKAFAPALGDAGVARMRNAIDAHDLPRLTVKPNPGGGAIVTLHDPDELLVAPIELEWRRASGDVELHTLGHEQPLTLEKHDPGDHLLLDPRDVHIRLSLMIPDDASYDSYFADLIPLVLPGGDDPLPALAALPGVHQRFAMLYAGIPAIEPEQLPDLLAGMHSDAARALALRNACTAAFYSVDPEAIDAWTSALSDALTDDPPLAGVASVSGYSDCSLLLDIDALFADDWDTLSAGLEQPTLSYPHVLYLSRFDLSTPRAAREVWEPVVRRGHSLRVRGVAAGELYGAVLRLDQADLADLPAWRSLVLDLLADNEASEVLNSTIAAAVALSQGTDDDTDVLDAFADLLHNPITWPVHARTLCSALAIADDDGDRAFLARLADAPLSDRALEILTDTTQCG